MGSWPYFFLHIVIMKQVSLLFLSLLGFFTGCSLVGGSSSCETWRTMRVGDKWGYENAFGKEVIPAQFDWAHRFDDNCFAEVQKNNPDGSGLVALIDSTGALRTEWCDYFRELDNGTYLADKEFDEQRKTQLLGTDLQPLTGWYDEIRSFEVEKLTVYQDGLAALMTPEGKLLTDFQFTSFEQLSEQLLVGEYWKDGDHRQALLNSDGKILSDWYGNIGELSENRMEVRVDLERGHKYGFIDERGELVIPAIYSSTGDFKDGLAKVGTGQFGGNIGFIDPEGKVVIDLIWSRELNSYEDMFLLSKSDGKYFVGKDGQKIAGPFHRMHCTTSGSGIRIGKGNGPFGIGIGRGTSCTEGFYFEGLMAVGKKKGSTYKWGFLDEKAQVALPFEYSYAWNFSQGLAAVEQKGKFGFINKNGEWVIERKFDHASPFEKGLARVTLDGKDVRIDTTGMVVEESW